MEIYTLLRQFADSWMLLALVLIFLGVIVWVFRPGARKAQEEAAMSIFSHDTKPAPGAPAARTPSKEPSK